VGKSTLSLDLLARLTVGREMPDGTGGGEPAHVILLSAEDDPSRTIAWRFKAAGGDPDRLTVITGVEEGGDDLPFTLPTHVGPLEEVIRDTGSVAVVLDVLMAYIDERVDTNSDSKSRRAMNSLQEVVGRTGVGLLANRHLRKALGSALYAGGGSIAYIGLARSGWLAAHDPEDEAMRVLASSKMNIAAKPPSRLFQLVPAEDLDNRCARVMWGGTTDRTADELLTVLPKERVSPAVNAAMQALKELISPGEEMWVTDVEQKLGDNLRISKSTIKRAREILGWPCFQERRTVDGTGARNAWRLCHPRQSDDHRKRSDDSDKMF
jgi:hypothetical protein